MKMINRDHDEEHGDGNDNDDDDDDDVVVAAAAAPNSRQDTASPETLLAVNRIYARAAIAGESEPVLAWTGTLNGLGFDC